MRWLLLVLTLISIGLTVQAFRWRHGAKDVPFDAIAKMYPGGLDHLSVAERQAMRERLEHSPILAVQRFPRLFAVISIALLSATVWAFLQG